MKSETCLVDPYIGAVSSHTGNYAILDHTQLNFPPTNG